VLATLKELLFPTLNVREAIVHTPKGDTANAVLPQLRARGGQNARSLSAVSSVCSVHVDAS
jgi:hypothetical protein